jgi:TrmH family RNA methyltransferase
MPLSKSKEKYIRSLHLKKNRDQNSNFIAEGEKLAKEILSAPHIQIESILAQKGWITNNSHLINGLDGRVEIVNVAELKLISQLTTPNQVLIVAKQLSPSIKEKIVASDWSLYLDRIQDPGNMGTILRIADWFGIKHVFCSPDSVELYNSKVIQASMGAFLRVNVIAIDFQHIKQQFPDLPVLATVVDKGTSVFHYQAVQHGIIIMGNESQGISNELLNQATHQITIPSQGGSGMESLNVAVATGIICGTLRNPILGI